ncbi:hypothetical protein B0H16DRAFT_325073 [Mycena metata]|uniref:Uncharacterized protein n=1 Tax=Mycena metata TaxID=1033252 RepID=A0AAD7HMY3_9AGAR|nr:hypothetical protein B0H16DRAFT_325073 [Mycena metata]
MHLQCYVHKIFNPAQKQDNVVRDSSLRQRYGDAVFNSLAAVAVERRVKGAWLVGSPESRPSSSSESQLNSARCERCYPLNIDAPLNLNLPGVAGMPVFSPCLVLTSPECSSTALDSIQPSPPATALEQNIPGGRVTFDRILHLPSMPPKNFMCLPRTRNTPSSTPASRSSPEAVIQPIKEEIRGVRP